MERSTSYVLHASGWIVAFFVTLGLAAVALWYLFVYNPSTPVIVDLRPPFYEVDGERVYPTDDPSTWPVVAPGKAIKACKTYEQTRDCPAYGMLSLYCPGDGPSQLTHYFNLWDERRLAEIDPVDDPLAVRAECFPNTVPAEAPRGRQCYFLVDYQAYCLGINVTTRVTPLPILTAPIEGE